ncbi:MAG TPA: hypothetical protein ENN99_04725 [Chloroflexi bacterium]|nr:hypothetical protein [Chloroflexota bacterium]
MKKPLTTAQKGIVLLGLLVLTLGLANLARAIAALWYNATLPATTTVPLTYLAAMAGCWGVLFVAAAVGLMRFRSWSRRGTLIAVTLYQTHVWINHALFDANEYARQTQPRDMALSLLLLTIIWGTLSLPRIQEVFKT